MTGTFLPRFACPECRAPLAGGRTGYGCARCDATYGERDGVFRFLTPERARRAEQFEQQYRLVRRREGYRVDEADYYRALPSTRADDPQAAVWRVRRESAARLLRVVGERRRHLPWARPVRALDLGAGNGWLSHRLTAAGCDIVALDRLDDRVDGLGVCRHYTTPFAVVQADFDALPFEPGQFDLAIFNGSLHYAPDPSATLDEARRMLAPGGAVAVMDSPMFRREDDGRAMADALRRRLTDDHGIESPVTPGPGFLTFGMLERAAAACGLRGTFVSSRGPLGWEARRLLGRVRLGRPAAAFGVWVAR